jgi:predicted transposase/invertase (TIGR01784 family)
VVNFFKFFFLPINANLTTDPYIPVEAYMQKIFFPPTAAILNPCKDAVFKLVFTQETKSSRGALSSLASAFIGQNTQVIAVTANEPPPDGPQDRQIRFDIACKFEDGKQADLEMTLYPKAYEAARMEYYLAKLYTNQDIKGEKKSFDDLKEAYQISFFARENLYSDTSLIHRFKYYDKKRQVHLGGRSEIITVELRKAAELLGKEPEEMNLAEAWALFFRYGADLEQRDLINGLMAEEEGIAMAGEALLTVSKDEQVRAWLMSAEKFDLDRQRELVSAHREGLSEGLSKGMAKGLSKGLSKGYRKAKVEVQKQLSMKDERIRQLEEEIRRLSGKAECE